MTNFKKIPSRNYCVHEVPINTVKGASKQAFSIHLIALVAVYTLTLTLFSCEDTVKDGIEKIYGESAATLHVEAISPVNGAPSEYVRFFIRAEAKNDISSIVVIASEEGMGGSQFDTLNPATDPIVNHKIGTVQPGTRSLQTTYRYQVPNVDANLSITFKLVEGGNTTDTVLRLSVLPELTYFPGATLYTKSSFETDGFSTYTGKAYRNLAQFEEKTADNVEVQEALDMLFFVEDAKAIVAAPDYTGFGINMFTRNETRFVRLQNITDSIFDGLTSGYINSLAQTDSIAAKGTSSIRNVKVGDYIGFVTDFNAANNYKEGVLKITALHPSQVEWYNGICYAMGIEVKVQQTKPSEE